MTLTKPDGKGLGFTVAGGAITTGGCYIKAVLQNPALSDGRLKPGDRLIKVSRVFALYFSYNNIVYLESKSHLLCQVTAFLQLQNVTTPILFYKVYLILICFCE